MWAVLVETRHRETGAHLRPGNDHRDRLGVWLGQHRSDLLYGMTDVVLAWSGGKDSTLALAALRADPRYRIVGLLTTITRDYDRISLHGVRRAVLEAQISALGLPLFEAAILAGSSNADYEAAFALALGAAQ